METSIVGVNQTEIDVSTDNMFNRNLITSRKQNNDKEDFNLH